MKVEFKGKLPDWARLGLKLWVGFAAFFAIVCTLHAISPALGDAVLGVVVGSTLCAGIITGVVVTVRDKEGNI